MSATDSFTGTTNDAADAAEVARPGDRGWPDLSAVRPPDGRVLAVVAVAAVAFDLAMRSGLGGLAGALLGVLLAGGMLVSGRIENPRAVPLIVAAGLFTVWLGVRSAEWVLALDTLAAVGLIVLGASFARRGDPLDLSVPSVVGRFLHAILHGVLAGAFAAAAVRVVGRHASGRAVAIVRGLLLGAPVIVVIALLLASADPVFASLFRLGIDVGDIGVHLVLLTLGAWGAAGLLRLASADPYAVAPLGRRVLGRVEAWTMLAALVAVFAAFTASQVATAVAGDEYVRRTAGLSYAEHARAGFFQLLAVAAITLALLLAMRAAVEAVDRVFVGLSEGAVALTLFVVAGALRRLWLYEQAYGLTLLRLCVVLFALWIAAVFVLLGLSLAGVGGSRSWLVPSSAIAALAMLFTLNVVNAEALIVRRNVERFAGTDDLDVYYLTRLSDDAVPALADALPSLTADQTLTVLRHVCQEPDRVRDGLWAYNAGRRAADAQRERVCEATEV